MAIIKKCVNNTAIFWSKAVLYKEQVQHTGFSKEEDYEGIRDLEGISGCFA
jgi:hypothetical protein